MVFSVMRKGEKMLKKYHDKWYVLNELSMTERQLDRAIKKASERHPLENKWIVVRNASNGQTTLYLCNEFLKWLKEVYLSDGYYLDLEIRFYESLILELQQSSQVKIESLKYQDMCVDDMMQYFKKDKESIRIAIYKLEKNYNSNLKFYKDDILFIKAEGIKWINEKYYRKPYLKYLENQKQLLDGNIV